MKIKTIGAFFSAILAAACGNFTAEPNDTSDTGDTGGTGGDKKAPNGLVYRAALSECDGFEANIERSDYCDAEIVRWSHDPQSEVFTFSDNRIVLNCCGEHDMTISLEEGVYTITEHDAPAPVKGGGTDRCACICSFDYEITVQNMPAEEIAIELLRDVTDDTDWTNALVWEGTLDLTEESGEIVIDDDPVENGCAF